MVKEGNRQAFIVGRDKNRHAIQQFMSVSKLKTFKVQLQA